MLRQPARPGTLSVRLIVPLAIIFAGTALTFLPDAPRIEAAAMPLTLEVLAPIMGKTPTEVRSGWSLITRIIANGELGIALAVTPPFHFPQYGHTGFILFDDPDGPNGCKSWVSLSTDGCEPPPHPINETYLEFSPDVDIANVADGVGNQWLQNLLTQTGGGDLNPKILVDNGSITELIPIGPGTGGDHVVANRCFNGFSANLGACQNDAECSAYPAATCQSLPTVTDGYGIGPMTICRDS